jgi:ABC-type nitrate/sulfonate/bicarbonate transport system permease component
MVGAIARTRVRRAVIALAVAAVVYGVVAQALEGVLPTRIVVAVHEIEGVKLLPPYPALWEEAVFLFQAGILVAGTLVSVGRVLAGLLLGALIGVPLGLMTGWAWRLESLARPLMELLRFTPALALLPLYVLWFGLGETSRVLLIATAVTVVAQQGAHQGVRQVPAIYWDVAAALGARPGLLLRRVVWPAALPQIMASLRIALGLGWVTLVVAELVKPTMPSLGYLLTLSGAYPRVPTMMLAIMTIGILVLVGDALLLGAYQWSTRWMSRRHD